MPVYNFICKCGEVVEARVGYGVDAMPCPCGQEAKRSAVNRVALGTKEKKYRVSDFQEASAELDYTATQIEQREGRPVKMPSPYKAGLRQAEKMGAKIRRPRA
jgi:hypothetical protein